MLSMKKMRLVPIALESHMNIQSARKIHCHNISSSNNHNNNDNDNNNRKKPTRSQHIIFFPLSFHCSSCVIIIVVAAVLFSTASSSVFHLFFPACSYAHLFQAIFWLVLCWSKYTLVCRKFTMWCYLQACNCIFRFRASFLFPFISLCPPSVSVPLLFSSPVSDSFGAIYGIAWAV